MDKLSFPKAVAQKSSKIHTTNCSTAHWPNFILSTSVIYTKLRPLGKRSPLRCDQRRNLFALEILERNGANLCRLWNWNEGGAVLDGFSLVLACKSGYSGPLRLYLVKQKLRFNRLDLPVGCTMVEFTRAHCCILRAYFSCSALNQNHKTNNNTKDSRKVTPSGTLESHKAKMMR